MVLIHNYKSFLLKKIIIKKSCIFSEKFKTKDVKYKTVNTNKENVLEDIYIQTPYLLLRYAPQIYEGNIDSKIVLDIPLKTRKLKTELSEEDNEPDNKSDELYQFIKKIHKSLKTKLIKQENKQLQEVSNTEDKVKKNKSKRREKYIECLKEKEDILDLEHKHFNLKTKIHSLNGKPYLKIYNSNRKLNKEQKFKCNTLTRFILHLESIWYFEDTYGFNWYVVQAEIKLPAVPQNYHFYNSEPINIKEEEVDDFNPQLIKFKKMRSMGVPQGAIEIKMRLEGVDPKLLFPDSLSSISLPLPISIPLPPPPPPLFGMNNIKSNSLLINKNINININKNKVKSPLMVINSRVPSLSQLQDQLKKLKKVQKK